MLYPGGSSSYIGESHDAILAFQVPDQAIHPAAFQAPSLQISTHAGPHTHARKDHNRWRRTTRIFPEFALKELHDRSLHAVHSAEVDHNVMRCFRISWQLQFTLQAGDVCKDLTFDAMKISPMKCDHCAERRLTDISCKFYYYDAVASSGLSFFLVEIIGA